jgi:hypothetical protein
MRVSSWARHAAIQLRSTRRLLAENGDAEILAVRRRSRLLRPRCVLSATVDEVKAEIVDEAKRRRSCVQWVAGD